MLLDIGKVINNKIKEHRNAKWRKTLESINVNDNSMWKIVRKFKKRFSQLPRLRHNNQTYSTDEKKGSAFCESFKVNFVNNRNNNRTQDEITNIVAEISLINTQNVPSKFLTSPKEVIDIIRKTLSKRAPGPDDIHNKLIKKLSKKAIVQLHYLINSILKLQWYPEKLKIVNVF